jgi:hypothetical protein
VENWNEYQRKRRNRIREQRPMALTRNHIDKLTVGSFRR